MPFDRTGASVRLLLDPSSPFRLLYVLQMMDCILAGDNDAARGLMSPHALSKVPSTYPSSHLIHNYHHTLIDNYVHTHYYPSHPLLPFSLTTTLLTHYYPSHPLLPFSPTTTLVTHYYPSHPLPPLLPTTTLVTHLSFPSIPPTPPPCNYNQ